LADGVSQVTDFCNQIKTDVSSSSNNCRQTATLLNLEKKRERTKCKKRNRKNGELTVLRDRLLSAAAAAACGNVERAVCVCVLAAAAAAAAAAHLLLNLDVIESDWRLPLLMMLHGRW